MFKKIFFFSTVFSLLFAQDDPVTEAVSQAEAQGYWKYHHTAAVGYRRDRESLSQSTGSSKYTHRNSLQLLLSSHVEWHRFIAHFRASYGWLVNGDYQFPKTTLGAGYSVDVFAEGGYRLKAVNRPSFGLSLIPLVGYGYFHMMNFPLLSKPNQQDWFGPFVEGRVELRMWEQSEWSFFYRYHWLDLRSKAMDAFYKGHNIPRHLAGTDYRFRFHSGFNFGFHFEGSSAWSSSADYVSKKPLAIIYKKASIHWVYYETDFSLGYQY